MGNYFPLLLILACPLMMIFMMRSMHGRRDIGAEDKNPGHDGHDDPTAAGLPGAEG